MLTTDNNGSVHPGNTLIVATTKPFLAEVQKMVMQIEAMLRSREGAEDDGEAGEQTIEEARVGDRDVVVGIYTQDAAVKGIAISLLLMAAIFQVADGVQIGAAGALRGYKDTRVPMAVNTVAYWVLAFPLAFLAAITFKAPPNYVWGGFVVGLGIAAVLLTWRYNRVSRL